MSNLTTVPIYDYTPYLPYLRIYTYISTSLSVISLPIYIYSLHYIAFRARKHIKNYNNILLFKLFWNFLYEQVSSGLALVWFSPILVNCPTGWISYLNIHPIIWQSVGLCLAHTLVVSISQLYFYQLKAAIWPSKYHIYIERIGHFIFFCLYMAGFVIFTVRVYHQGGPQDRKAFSAFAKGLPDYFWSDNCYVTALPAFHPEVLPLYAASATMVTINAVFIYTIPAIAIIVIIAKFRKATTRNAKFHRKLLFSLVLQTLIYFLFYLVPTHISQSSLTSIWFNPIIIELTIFCTQIHGSLIVIVLFATTKPFREDLLNDLHIKRFDKRRLSAPSHTFQIKLRSTSIN